MTPDRRSMLRAIAGALAASGVGGRVRAATAEVNARVYVRVIGAMLSAAYNPLFAADAIADTRSSFMARYPNPTEPLPNPITGENQAYPFGGNYVFGDWMFDPSFPGKPSVATVLGDGYTKLWRDDLAKLEPAIKTQLTGIVVHFLVNSITAKFGAEKNTDGDGHKVAVGPPNTAARAQSPSRDVTVYCPT